MESSQFPDAEQVARSAMGLSEPDRDKVRAELKALGHDVRTVPPRSGTFGYGQAVMSDGTGVHFGASEPRHDGAAIPEAPPVFTARQK